MAWIKAMSEGDQFVKFHSRFIDGTNGGIASVRVEVDGVVLAVIPDPASQQMHAAMAARNDGGDDLRPVSRACLDGQHDQCPGMNSAGATCTCGHHDGRDVTE